MRISAASPSSLDQQPATRDSARSWVNIGRFGRTWTDLSRGKATASSLPSIIIEKLAERSES